MKKHLLKGSLLAFLFSASAAQSQTVYFSDDFSSGNLNQWTLTDDDGDGENWYNFDAGGTQGEVATSASWTSGAGPLNPDNWMVSPQIDLTSATGTITLSWLAYGQDQQYADENYTVYVATANDIATLSASGTSFNEVLGPTSGYASRSIDVSAFAGQNIYVGFRHHNVSDEFRLNIDNVGVKSPTVGLDLSAVESNMPIFMEGDRDFEVVVENVGNVAVTSFDIEYTLNGGATQTANFTGLNMSSFDMYTATINITGVMPGNGQTFTYDIVNINGGSTDVNTSNNSGSDDYDVLPPVPNFTLTDTYGEEHDLHTVLGRGQAVVLDFFASWCGPCQSSTPELNQLYEDNNSGLENLEVFGITIEPTDNTDAIVNNLGWGATYPKFKFSNAGYLQYYHYARNHQFNTGSIPFFVMICPDVNDPAHSTIATYDVGFASGMFNGYQTELDNCASATFSSVSIEEENITEQDISIFPNPFTNIANVNFTIEGSKKVTISLFNTVGQEVISEDLGTVSGPQNYKVDGSDLGAGMYIVNITIDDKMITKKVTLNK